MEIVLAPEIEEAIRQKVERGDYNSASDMVNVAVSRLLDQEEEDIEELRQEIAIGLEEFQRGEYQTYDRTSLKTLRDEIIENGKKLLAEERKQASA
jgi:putative addiction module CopG family antidote